MKLLEWLTKLVKPKSKRVASMGECKHPEWWPETKENGWRGSCKTCGIKAYGSCQWH